MKKLAMGVSLRGGVSIASNALLSFACLSFFPASADESAMTLRGFGTLGMARSSSTAADFVRDLSQPNGSHGQWTGKVDSVLGVQANYRFDERLEAVAQAISRYRYDGSYRPELGWGFLKFELNPQLSLRLGRIGAEVYMMADSRHVGYSYLPIRPPVDYFGLLPISYVDGGDAMLAIPAGDGVVRLNVFSGIAREKFTVSDRVWDVSGSRIQGAYVDFQQGAWQWRATYAHLSFGREFPAEELRSGLRLTGAPSAVAAADALSIAGRSAHYYSVGAVYEKGALQAQLMLSHTSQESPSVPSINAGYGLLGYRFSSLTPYVGISRARSLNRTISTGLPDAFPPFAALNGGVTALLNESRVDQRTVFLGARWDIRPNVALKAQWDRVSGQPGSVALVQWESPAWKGRTDVIGVTLDFVF